jgi:hypothetical protein
LTAAANNAKSINVDDKQKLIIKTQSSTLLYVLFFKLFDLCNSKRFSQLRKSTKECAAITKTLLQHAALGNTYKID